MEGRGVWWCVVVGGGWWWAPWCVVVMKLNGRYQGQHHLVGPRGPGGRVHPAGEAQAGPRLHEYLRRAGDHRAAACGRREM